MRYRIVVLMLLFVLPVRYPFAAPAPERPYAILDIGPPPKGKTAEEHRKEQIHYLTGSGGLLWKAWGDREVKKLRLFDSVRKSVKGKDIFPWLEKTMQVTPEKGGRRLRLTFRAGTQAEQAVVINTLLRIYFRIYVTEDIQNCESVIRSSEEARPRLAKDIKEAPDVATRKRYQMEWDGSKARDADLRDKIARLKHVAVIKWAK